MDHQQIGRIRTSFAALAPHGPTLIERFYENLFAAHPEVRAMFPKDMTQQKQHLLAALVLVANNVDRFDTLQKPLREMGSRHLKYGTKPEHYPVVRDNLLKSMREVAGKLWNDTLEADWTAAINAVAQEMIHGAAHAKPSSS